MKTTFKKNYRAGLKQHKLPRVRLTPSSQSRRPRLPAVPPATVPAVPTPAIVVAETESIPMESLHGDTLQLYLREIGQVKLLTPKEGNHARPENPAG